MRVPNFYFSERPNVRGGGGGGPIIKEGPTLFLFATTLRAPNTSFAEDGVKINGSPGMLLVCVKKACKLAGNRHFLAVLSGASISPARMAATGAFEDHSCPFCGGQWATRWHLFWGCPNNNRTMEVPQDELQQQLGFPSTLCSDNYNRQVLEHVASIRRTVITTNWRRRRLVGG